MIRFAISRRFHCSPLQRIALLKTSDLKDRYIADGLEIIGSTPDELTAYMKSETIKWAEVIKRSGVKID